MRPVRGLLRLAAALAVAGCAATSVQAAAQAKAPTFNRDIAPLLWTHCGSCHRDSALAPFALLEYADVRPRARQILAAIRNDTMPPWLPEPGHGDFAGERRLSSAEKQLIENWVNQGTLEGDRADRRPAPAWPVGWQLGQPDLVVEVPEAYVLTPGTGEVFRNFVVPVQVPSTRYVRGIEMNAGNMPHVHHASIAIDPTRGSRALDDADPQPGFAGAMLSDTTRTPESRALGWTPGMTPYLEPPDMAWRLEAGTDLLVLVHMIAPAAGGAALVRPRVGFFFADAPPARAPLDFKLGSKVIDIPAGNAAYTITDTYTLPTDVDVLSVYPHAHYLAKEIKVSARLPDGGLEWLIWIRKWDFHWQDQYRYRKPVFLPRGTRLTMEYVYDNSAANRQNPNRPPKRVRYGGQSSDEMGDVWLRLVPRDPAGASVLARGHQEEEARRDIDLARSRIVQEPANARWRNLLGVGLMAAGNIPAAAAAFLEAVRLDAGFGEAHHNLGYALQRQGDLPAAIAHMRQAVTLSPGNYVVHVSLGNVLDEAGQPTEAIEAFRRAIALNPAAADAHNNVGVALGSLGFFQEAMTHFRLALEIRPEYQDAQQNLQMVLELVRQPGGLE